MTKWLQFAEQVETKYRAISESSDRLVRSGHDQIRHLSELTEQTEIGTKPFQNFTLDDAGKVIDLNKLREAGRAAGFEPTSENLRRWSYMGLCGASEDEV